MSTHEPVTDNNASIIAKPHARIGRLTPTQRTLHQLSNHTDLLVGTKPDTVGGTRHDTAQVKACLDDAVTYYHQNLPDAVRTAITEKWGLADSIIDARDIGYTDGSNGVVEYLLENGYTKTTIVRAGLASASVLNHLFGCTGIAPENEHLVADNRVDEEVASSCSHTDIPEAIDILVRGQLQGHIQPEQINLQAVVNHVESTSGLSLWNWWDHRIIFPYRNRHGEYTYLIGRATDKTDDRVYSNGVVDRTDSAVTTIADTRLGDQLDYDDDTLNSYIVLQYEQDIFKTPDEDGVRERTEQFKTRLDDAINGDQDADTLIEFGVIHDPSAATATNPRITIADTSTVDDIPDVFIDPAATGVTPGDSISIVNHTDYDADISVTATPDGVWWDDTTVTTRDTFDCAERGYYRFTISIDDTEYNTIVKAYDDIYTGSRDTAVENWVGDEPGFNLDVAKYVKQTIDRPWINHDAVSEPIFGIDTVHEGKPLLVTEGVTDALMAHQHGFPCIAPATTNIKEEHFTQLPENISTVYIVNDNESNNAGLNGALRNAKIFENNGQTALVGELPRPDGQDKIDLAEFLQHHSRDELLSVLEDATPPERHPHFDPSQHDPAYTATNGTDHGSTTDDTDNTRSSGQSQLSDSTLASDTTSALYGLTLEDVINWDVISERGTSGQAGSVLYRGPNPIQHHGNSEGYFVIRDHGDYITAKDYKIASTGNGYYYNPLTWLATEAPDTDRSVRNPAGSLSNEEIWKMWKYAKQAEHIPVPDDDPIPLRAVWYITEKHDLFPSDMIPDSFDDTDDTFSQRLTATPFNNALDIIREQYGLDPGRDYRTQ